MKKLIVIGAISTMLLSGCGQYAAKNFGGEYDVDLPKGQKLVNVTWKEDHLWYLTKPMTANDKAETYSFHEDSLAGVMEGTVTIKEHK